MPVKELPVKGSAGEEEEAAGSEGGVPGNAQGEPESVSHPRVS